jgi:hypothetical protein
MGRFAIGGRRSACARKRLPIQNREKIFAIACEFGATWRAFCYSSAQVCRYTDQSQVFFSRSPFGGTWRWLLCLAMFNFPGERQ